MMDSNYLRQLDSARTNNAGTKQCRKVRVVAKVRGHTCPEAEIQGGSSRSVDWISVNKPNGEGSEGVAISFGEQSSSRKESYLLDYFYGENEENEMIYSRDVKPLISTVFEGHNSTIIACGARVSGKTHVIQGSAETPGLSVLAITEFLSVAEQDDKSIAVSFYEVDHQEHAVDLLNPEQPTILVFEDRGRIQFKGLSQIPVKSVSEFQKLHLTACARKTAMKKGNERARRSHMGLIVHVFSNAEGTETGSVGKMNLVDMAGYEDARKKSSDSSCLAETNKINMSIYALLNVFHALSTNESRVPFRESKLTRMLQDSLRGTSRILMVICMNPSFCQDTISMVSLVSRSCQGFHRVALASTKKSGSSARQMMLTSHKSQMLKSVSTTAKNLTGSRSNVHEKKAADVLKSAIKGRKLFDEASHSSKAEKENSIAKVTKAPVSVTSSLDNSFPDASYHMEHKPMEENVDSVSDARYQAEPVVEKLDSVSDASYQAEPVVEKVDSVSDASYQAEPVVKKVAIEESEDRQEEHTPNSGNYSKALSIIDSTVQKGDDMNKENDSLIANKDGSPPISTQLREISNNLKFLLSSTPLCVKIPEPERIPLDNQVSPTDILDPKTPVSEQTTSVSDKWDIMNAKSPWQTYSMRSSGMKNSLVQEYLRFLNTADKEELKRLKGIGEKRATFILELREESPEPFKSLDDLKDIGLSAKQIKGMMKKEVGELFK